MTNIGHGLSLKMVIFGESLEPMTGLGDTDAMLPMLKEVLALILIELLFVLL
jgi:hypothetical protein